MNNINPNFGYNEREFSELLAKLEDAPEQYQWEVLKLAKTLTGYMNQQAVIVGLNKELHTRIDELEARLELAIQALMETGYYSREEIGEHIAERIVELFAALEKDSPGNYRRQLENTQMLYEREIAKRRKWKRHAKALQKRLAAKTVPIMDECGQPFPCAHRAYNEEVRHPLVGGPVDPPFLIDGVMRKDVLS